MIEISMIEMNSGATFAAPEKSSLAICASHGIIYIRATLIHEGISEVRKQRTACGSKQRAEEPLVSVDVVVVVAVVDPLEPAREGR